MQEPLMGHDQLQKQFDEAAKSGVWPGAWLPPLWADLVKNGNKFFDTATDAGQFDNKTTPDQRVGQGEKKNQKPLESLESGPNDQGWVSPMLDFDHDDPTEDYNQIEKALQANTDALGKLRRLIGPDSQGMKRLGRIFDWVLYRTTELLGNLNYAAMNKKDYETARADYINFLRDLDDHEPERDSKKTKLDPRDKKSASGYGRAIKWSCIAPVIFQGEITGARVVCKWNPHSSSNGIPVKHP